MLLYLYIQVKVKESFDPFMNTFWKDQVVLKPLNSLLLFLYSCWYFPSSKQFMQNVWEETNITYYDSRETGRK